MPSISKFYEDAYKLTGGKNIVNAILGDFRALDTLFEGLVLIIAGLGIYTLLNYKDRRDKMKENDVVLKTVTKIVVFILLTFDFMFSLQDIIIQVVDLLAALSLVQLLSLCSLPLMLKKY